jgi:hypothetical protein
MVNPSDPFYCRITTFQLQFETGGRAILAIAGCSLAIAEFLGLGEPLSDRGASGLMSRSHCGAERTTALDATSPLARVSAKGRNPPHLGCSMHLIAKGSLGTDTL